MADTTPTLPVPDGLRERYNVLKDVCVTKYGESPLFYARSSGRVNLIGEHIDYCGYGVLPMAIEQDIVVAVSRRNDNKLCLTNVDNQYQDFVCSLDDIVIDKAHPKWHHYFLCGVKGIADFNNVQPSDLVGMNIALDGRIPSSAGLSSSSALVCAAALATANAYQKLPSKKEIAELCAKCEHYIGTEGGGMDQSIAFLAQPGTAKFIEFNPLRAQDVVLPDGAVFVVANSCAEINKAATGHFNSRVAEVRLASQVIAKLNNLNWREINTLGKLQAALGLPLSDMAGVVSTHLHKGIYTKEEISQILGVSMEELDKISLSERTWSLREFKLFDRAMHVYTEADRVHQFQNACDKKPDDCLQQLGDLMNKSHASCRDLYECSAPALDQLCQLACDSGALGSRLTGAGWGGCCVSLVPKSELNRFLKSVEAGYYNQNESLTSKVKSALFASQPGGGAAIYTL